jgi:drug/metabolite transporter (DMT)-like permease
MVQRIAPAHTSEKKAAMIAVSEKRYAAAALASVSLIWGYNFIMMKTGLAYVGPLQFATLKFCLGAVCLIPVLIQPWNLASGLAASMLATCAGMFWGVSVVYVKNLRKKTSISMLMIALWQMIFGALVLALGWLCFEAGPINWTAPLADAVLYNGVLGTGLACMLFYYALRRMPAGMAGLGL